MKHRMFVLGLVCLSSVFRPFLSEAQAPSLINYQGRLVSGTNLVNGNVGLSLRLFNVPSGGSSIYEDSNSVTVVDGLYATFLGDQTNSGNFVSALTNATVFVEVAVNGVALAPRERIASVAYALDANNAAAVGGLPAGALATGTPVYVESDPFWSAASNGMQSQITAETAARLGADAALTNLISDETAARLGTGAALSNSVASLATNVAARLDSNAWAAADSTTNYVRRTGDTMSGVLTNLAGFVGNGAGVTNVDLGSVTAISTRPNVIAWGYNFYGQTNVPESATGVVAVAAGGMHSLALRGDGTVIAWGYNVYGQTNVPESATGVVAIAGGFYHNLALRGDGTVIAWGYNDYGQTNVPATATGVVAVAAGAFHSLALRGDGTVIAWGYNFYGQTNVPATATGVVAIASGDSHSLALRGDGTVIAWGQNSSGQTNVPESATGVVAVAGGGLHSLALRGDGTVIAWGDNSSGQTNVPASATGVVAVGASSSHSLALRGDGTVIAWGQNSSGQTNVPATATGVVAIAGGGDHSLALRSARVPAQLARLDAAANTFAGTVTAASFSGNGAGLTGLAASSLAPSLATNLAYLNGANQTFSGPLNFSSVSNTFTGTFSGNGAGVTNVDLGSVTAIATRPNVIAWGDNSYGQTNVPVTAAGVVAIAGGGDHSLALRGDGTVIAWGYNVSGQTNVPATATGVVAVAGGGSHSLALRGNGTVIAWGRNFEGQTNVPATATGVVAIAGGGAHSLALRGNGTVIAWGYNLFGQTNVPATATGVVAIAGGGYHSLALRGNGTVIAWGDNTYGQTNVPATATGVVAIAGGGYHSLALRGDGTVIAWGEDFNGQTNVPATATGVVAVAAGNSHSFALRGDGTVIAWGDDSYGQTNVPASATGVEAIAAGGNHSLALRSARASASLARLDAATNTFAGTVTAAAFVGNGVGLTGLVHTAGDTMTGALNLPAGGLAVGANQLVVTPSGNVGIGMASPPHMLDVNATSGIPTIAVGDLNGTNALFYMRANVGSGAAGTLDLLSRNAHDFTFISFPGGVGTEYMRIKGTNGNVGIGTSNPTNKLHVVGTVQATAYITGSDRNAKENVQPVSVDEILAKVAALPISTWTFKEQDSGTHLGPMAQDFYAAFNLGNTDSGIFTVDENGVALAAIQGLKKDADAKDAKIEALQRQVDELRALIQQLSTQGK